MEKKKKKATLYLPSELNTEILLRLPVKSLIRLKSVCKSWFTLISDTNFANSHFQFSESTQTTRSRILSISGLPPQIRSIDFQALLNDNHSVSPNPNLSLPQSFFPLRIRGSCKGFIFLNCSAYNLLWNPSTGFHKQIPSSPNTRSLFGTNSNLYGFGYDHSRDDYLLVSLYCDAFFAEDTSSPLEIFSLRDNIWKQIVDTHHYSCGYQNRKAGLLFNGAIHWFLTGWENVIVAFDLMERKLLKISLPVPDGLAFHLPDIRLWVFGEFLSLWAIMDGIVEIWVMKEYKVHSSWTKTLVFPIYDIRSFSHDIPYFSPIYSKKNGDIVGTIRGTGLAKYNSKGQLSKHCSYCDDSRGSQAVMYTESLLSLPSDSKQV